MKVIVDCDVGTAWTRGASWESDNPRLRDTLELFAGRDEARRAYGYVPSMALAMAMLAEERLPYAKIVGIEDEEPEDQPGVVY